MKNEEIFETDGTILEKYTGEGEQTVIIPEGITEISDYAFDGNEEITRAEIPASVTKIGDSAFDACVHLESVKFSEGLTEIGSDAFYGCAKLKEISFPTSLKRIESSAFTGCGFSEVVFPDTLEFIGANSFADCAALERVSIGKSVRCIDTAAFCECAKLTKIDVHPENDFIAFKDGCLIDVKQKTLILALTGFTVPSDGSVTALGNSALRTHNELTSFEVPAFIRKIGHFVFGDCDKLRRLTVAAANGRFYAENDCIIEKATGTLVFGLNPEEIPRGKVKIIGAEAFSGKGEYSKLTVPEGVEEIGAHAFSDFDSLRAVNLPDSLKIIRDGAFLGCQNLETVNFGGGLETIEGWSFCNCKNLKEIRFPASLKEIGRYAFCDSGLTSAVFEAPKKWTSYDWKEEAAKVKFKKPLEAAKLLNENGQDYDFKRKA